MAIPFLHKLYTEDKQKKNGITLHYIHESGKTPTDLFPFNKPLSFFPKTKDNSQQQ